MSVFVLAQDKTPLSPTTSARARLLLSAGDAAVFRRYPFTIILKRPPSDGVIQPLRLKLDPGSKVTGIALVNNAGNEKHIEELKKLAKKDGETISFHIQQAIREYLERKAAK